MDTKILVYPEIHQGTPAWGCCPRPRWGKLGMGACSHECNHYAFCSCQRLLNKGWRVKRHKLC